MADTLSTLKDFLFGSKTLKDAANTPAPPSQPQAPAVPYQSMQQIAQQAQAQADRQRQLDQNAKIPAGHVNVANPASHQDKLDHE